MKLLNRYIVREVSVPAIVALLALTFITVAREISSLLELIVRQSATGDEVWAIVWALLPSAFVLTIPMALLVGILTGLGRMSSDSESIAFRAGGIPTRAILLPILTLAILTWIANLALSTWVAPTAIERVARLTQSIALRQLPLELQPRVFNEDLGNMVLYVREISPDRTQWDGVFLADLGTPEEPRVTFAKSGQLSRNSSGSEYEVTLQNGSTHIVTPLEPDRYSFSNFGSYTLPLSLAAVTLPPVETSPPQIRTSVLLNSIERGEASFAEQVEFHRRIALPFACIAFALIGLPLGLSTHRGGRSTGLVLSVVLMLAYYLVFLGGTRIAGNAQLSPVLGAWGANLLFVTLGVVLLARSDRDRRNRVLDLLLDTGTWLRERLRPKRREPRPVGRFAYSLTHHPTWFRTLDLYVLKGFWFFFILVLVVFVTLFAVVTLFELLPDIVKNGVGTDVVAGYFFYFVPQILYLIVPLTVLVAAFVIMGTLTKANETLAVKAGAISLYRMSVPLLLMALALSGAIYLMQDYVLPYTNQKQDEFRNTIKGRAAQTYSTPRKWMAGSGNHIYYYNYFEPELNAFAGLSVFTYEPDDFSLTQWTFASQASWESSSWRLSEGWTRSFQGNGGGYTSFESRDYPQMAESPDYFKKEVRVASQMNYPELRRYIDDLRQGGFDVSRLMVDLHRKVSFPLVSVIMALIAIPFSLATGRRGAFFGIGISIAVGISYWATFEVFEKLGGINRLSPIVAAWFPNLIFGSGGIWLLLKVRT